MVNDAILKEYAELTVKIGANVQKGQVVAVNCGVENAFFGRLVSEAAYEAGASRVIVLWNDEVLSKIAYQYQTLEIIEDIPEYRVAQYDYLVDEGACIINIIGDTPGFMADVDPEKMQKAAIATNSRLSKYRDYTMGNKGQWTIVGIPTVGWAKKVFPDLEDESALNKLWEAVLSASRVSGDGTATSNWQEHNQRLAHYNKLLNDFDFDSLYFKNSIGTDLTIGLADNHVWCGGSENTTSGVQFNPNIPTEENFTMPSKYKVNGTVVATMPLNYQGKLIDGFSLTFKDGKVIEYQSNSHEEVLQKMLDTDEGSRYLGEVALISYDSPIQKSGVLFLNTLYDENASCHLALGRAYPMNIQGGTAMQLVELEKRGYNMSMIHVDFMFGSPDMSIVGTKKDGTTIQVFEEGNFVI